MTEGLAGVTVGHFGHFDPEYARNRIMAKALRRAGATVVPIIDRRPWARRMPALWRRGVEAARAGPSAPVAAGVDLLLVGFPGQADVAVARAAAAASGRGVPVLSDAFNSIYETAEDREGAPPSGLRGRRYLLEDRWSCRLADVVLLDTQAHIAYFCERFGQPAAKFRRAWLGADDEVMHPRGDSRRDGTGGFRVFFYGGFTPLQGVEHIVRAAHHLERSGEEVAFVLVGGGPASASAQRLGAALGVGSIRYEGWQPPARLADLMADSDVCLGIFGGSAKAGRVIPNKAFDALAMGRALVTADSPAAREAFEDRTHAWLCPPADGEALAEAIATLKADDDLRRAMADEGHRLFRRRFCLDALALDLTALVTEALGR